MRTRLGFSRWMLMIIGGLLAVGVLGTTVGCRRSSPTTGAVASHAPGPAWFENITDRAGLDFIHQAQISGEYLMSEVIGSGAAFLDFDQDDRLDIYLIHNVNPTALASNRLFQQQADGRFKDVSAGSGLDVRGYGNGLAVGDVNNDGLPEVVITEYDRIRLFLNQGVGKFTDVTAAAGLTNQHWSVPAAFFDYDRDGWLDLVVGNYLDFDPTQKCPDAKGQPDFCGPHGFRSTITRLFHNSGLRPGAGTTPRFEEVTVPSGFARAPGKAMQIVCADFDGDRWPDVFITDDGLPNRLFVNQSRLGKSAFKEEAVERGLAYTGTGTALANMGVALGDSNGDALFDLFVPHLTEENHTLWRQRPRGIFQDDTAGAGLLSMPWHGTGFSAVFADFDCDGALDLAIANGLVRRRVGKTPARIVSGLAPFWTAYAETSQLFVNEGTGRFREISPANPAFCGEALVGRALLSGDLDNDGGLDVLITSLGGPARLYRNAASGRGHWLGIRAVLPALGHRDAYGAEIVVQAGDRRWWRLIQPAYGYASSNDPRVHFGLGAVTSVDFVHVVWPDGVEENFPGGPVDRYVLLRQGTGAAVKLGSER